MKLSLAALALPVALPVALPMGLWAASAVQAETLAEALTERQQRVALELEAGDLLVKLHHQPLDPELQPCINGGVSPDGRSASAEIERVVWRLAAGDLTGHLAGSAYYRAFDDGRITLTD